MAQAAAGLRLGVYNIGVGHIFATNTKIDVSVGGRNYRFHYKTSSSFDRPFYMHLELKFLEFLL